ncbi:REP-associated tyrosine transposase [Jannaschia sp. LMIT008]|uniref:REP-associated tyrosine transposase n=1 Tax=Jannaschia maritima TaxID=3032585 RepID=UPI00281131F6|nr:transposase [Jannaschia sp. LMIT008]
MANYIRTRLPGGTFFFTVNLAQADSRLLVERIDLLRAAYDAVRRAHPFRTDAIVVLPNHLHAVWTMSDDDGDYSNRWRLIKRNFTVALGQTRDRTGSKAARGEAGIWQRRFWERCIRNEAEYTATVRYVLTNPVKHGFTTRAVDWPHSSIHRDIRAGRLSPEGL